jgi:SAM-dependent methyltransferase
VSEPRFDVEDVFDEDYLHFYAEVLTDERTEREVDLIWRLLELGSGTEVLDLACGHGRIANPLAARGGRVTGLDATPLFLDYARRDAAARGVDVEYVEGDMRALPWAERFDAAIVWFTSFGYFGDDDNRRVLAEAAKALRTGGRLAIDVHNRDALVRRYDPGAARVTERDGDFLIDRGSFDVNTGRDEVERVVVRGGRVRRMRYSVRHFTFTELRDWLCAAGFADVAGYDGGWSSWAEWLRSAGAAGGRRGTVTPTAPMGSGETPVVSVSRTRARICAEGVRRSERQAPVRMRSSSSRMRPAARSTRRRFAGSLSQPLAPDGCGRGTAAASPYANRRPTTSASPVRPSSRLIASPPTGTITAGRSSRSSHSRQNAHSSCSRGVGVRSPRPEGAFPG